MCRHLIMCMMQHDSLLDFVTRRRKLCGYTSPEQVPCITHLARATLPARDVQLFCNIFILFRTWGQVIAALKLIKHLLSLKQERMLMKRPSQLFTPRCPVLGCKCTLDQWRSEGHELVQAAVVPRPSQQIHTANPFYSQRFMEVQSSDERGSMICQGKTTKYNEQI